MIQKNQGMIFHDGKQNETHSAKLAGVVGRSVTSLGGDQRESNVAGDFFLLAEFYQHFLQVLPPPLSIFQILFFYVQIKIYIMPNQAKKHL